MSIDTCRLVELPKIRDHWGNLTFLEGLKHVPFDIKRVFYVYDIPSGEDRGRTPTTISTSSSSAFPEVWLSIWMMGERNAQSI